MQTRHFKTSSRRQESEAVPVRGNEVVGMAGLLVRSAQTTVQICIGHAMQDSGSSTIDGNSCLLFTTARSEGNACHSYPPGDPRYFHLLLPPTSSSHGGARELHCTDQLSKAFPGPRKNELYPSTNRDVAPRSVVAVANASFTLSYPGAFATNDVVLGDRHLRFDHRQGSAGFADRWYEEGFLRRGCC